MYTLYYVVQINNLELRVGPLNRNRGRVGGMGFRDLVLFNQSMLERQGWRLLTEPNSLCARVLFPHTDFWHAPKPRLVLLYTEKYSFWS
jgi:hypothetical protein